LLKKLSFNDHINYIKNKASAKLGFLKRSWRKFRHKSALITLYNSLVRFHFDYALLIWHSYSVTQKQHLNKIQNNFIKFLWIWICFHIYRAPRSPYDITINFFNILTLEKRFMQLKLKFLYKILNNLVDCPELLQNINFKINSINCQIMSLFYIKHTRTNYMLNSPSNVLMSTGNSMKDLDFFNKSLSAFVIYVIRMIQ
jgi:hypothetical protein